MTADDEVLTLLSGKNVLIDAVLLGLSIQQDDEISLVRLKFAPRHGSDFSSIELEFTNVSEVGINYLNDSMPLDIWDLKFLRTDAGKFYITLDPDPATLGSAGIGLVVPSDTDEFFVLADHVTALVIEASRQD